MKRAFIDFVKEWTSPSLPAVTRPVDPLMEAEKTTLSALYRLVVCDEEVAFKDISAFLDQQVAADERYTMAYREGATLLDAAAHELANQGFADIDLGTRSRALGLLLKDYAHPDCESSWTRRFRFTGFAREQAFAAAEKKRLRTYLVREFLRHRFADRRGWELVGYKSFPGFPAEEESVLSLEKVETRRHSIAMHLSDGTVEAWTPDDFARGVSPRNTQQNYSKGGPADRPR